MATEDDKQDRRIEKLEERVNLSERELAALGTKLTLVKDDLSRRINETHVTLKADVEHTRVDLRERIDALTISNKADMERLHASIATLSETAETTRQSLQNLYVTQKGAGTKVAMNEKIVWGILTVAGSVGLYLLQDLIKLGGGS